MRTVPPDRAAFALDIFLSTDDPAMVPTWTKNPDGSIRLDLCLTCSMSMTTQDELDERVN